MKNRLTSKERVTIWNSYSKEQQKQLLRIREWLAPGYDFKIERW